VTGAAVVIPAGKTIVLDVSPPALASLTVDGTLRFAEQDIALSSGWIVVRGRFEIGSEAQPFQHQASITLTGLEGEDVMGMGAKVFGAMSGGAIELHGAKRAGWTRLVASAAAGTNQLKLEQAVDWKPGDHLVVASTDLDPQQAEELYVAGVQGTTVTVSTPLHFAHFGLSQTFAGKPLEERAEVGLLSRNIVLRGDDASNLNGFGGHMMAMQGGIMHIEGVEITRMGQKKVLARYPMHWHLEGAVDGQYFRDNSVWHTYNRCVTVHGTSNAVVAGNVCYDDIGHAYFLEDGAETGNLFEDNLGVLTRLPAAGEAVIPTDVTPATFWITNPDNTYRRNVAAGSRGFGFWFALPASPTGLSTGSALLPRETPLREFSDNVAHSNSNSGLLVDNGPKADLTTETVNYSPRQTPGTSSPAVIAFFRNFTAYKHGGRAVWLRGSSLRLTGAMLADNAIGATFAANETFVQDAVFVGLSANSGGTQISASFPIRGYEFYDGRVGAERVSFVNYQAAGRVMSALGFNRSNGFPVSTGNYDLQITLENANAVYLENPAASKDGDKAAIILDSDGSVTGTPGAFVAANHPIMVTPACSFRTPWNAWVCVQPFVQLQIRGANAQVVAPLTLVRDDAVQGGYVGVPQQPQTVSASLVPGRRYTVQYGVAVPDRPQFFMNRSNPGDWIRLTLPYPNPNFNVIRDSNNGAPLTAAASLAELDASTGNKYWYDVATGTLHLKAVTQTGRTSATLFVVPK
jgi:cell migration-inducing and hyaluronan-binding protein